MARWRGRQSQTGLQRKVLSDDKNEDEDIEKVNVKGGCDSYAGSHNSCEGGRPTRSICQVCIFSVTRRSRSDSGY